VVFSSKRLHTFVAWVLGKNQKYADIGGCVFVQASTHLCGLSLGKKSKIGGHWRLCFRPSVYTPLWPKAYPLFYKDNSSFDDRRERPQQPPCCEYLWALNWSTILQQRFQGRTYCWETCNGRARTFTNNPTRTKFPV